MPTLMAECGVEKAWMYINARILLGHAFKMMHPITNTMYSNGRCRAVQDLGSRAATILSSSSITAHNPYIPGPPAYMGIPVLVRKL